MRTLGALFLAMCVLLTPVVPVHASGSPASAPGTTQSTVARDPWTVRCSEPTDKAPKECEVFQRLILQKTGQRIVEFAVGFPQSKETKGKIRGAIIMPLGILLTEDPVMQIDDGKKFKFKVRYCTNAGCYAFLDLNDSILESIKKGREIVLTARTFAGQPLEIKMALDGFSGAAKKISQ